MNVDKWPRWALISLVAILSGICVFFTNRAVADGDKIRSVAYEARTNANKAIELGNDLKVQIADVRGAQETFRREYREDQKDQNRKLGAILYAIDKQGVNNN